MDPGAPVERVRFGLNVSTFPTGAIDPVAEAGDAEALGFDLVTVHRDVLHGAPPSLELWTVLAWLAARTERVAVAPNVLALPNRHPAVVAKMAETLDRLSGGRVVMALGAGWVGNDAAVGAFGLPVRSAAEKVQAIEEAVDVMRGLWTQAAFTHRGRHFSVDQAGIEPRPSRPIPIWLGAFGPRMLDLTGRKADGWFPSLFLLPPEKAFGSIGRIRRAASSAGRDPDGLTYAYNVGVVVDEGAHPMPGKVVGPPDHVASQLAGFVRGGFDLLNLWPGGDLAQQRARLAAEVIPAVRDRLS